MKRGHIQPVVGSSFHTSSFSGGTNCVAVFLQPDGSVWVRHSKRVGSQVLQFTGTEWNAFVKGVKNNEFDVELSN
jgi:hypothetical protein